MKKNPPPPSPQPSRPSRPSRPTTIDDYLAALGDDQRAALEKVRRIIQAAAPGAEECISYQMPAFRLNGKALMAFGAATGHCAIYPMSGTVLKSLADELSGFETSKGTIRFPATKPPSTALLRKLVKARIAELGG